jgi:hypothetical protein
MRILTGIVLAVCLSGVSVFAETETNVSGVGAVQFTKKDPDLSSGNLDGAWVRGELKVSGKLESGLEGLLHFRIQPNMAYGTETGNMMARQVAVKLPVYALDILFGRWYDVYGPGYYYFGRYLHGVSSKGSGIMNTDYNVVDGVKLAYNIESIKSKFQVAVLPKDLNFKDVYLMAMFGGSPVEGLKFNVGGNFEIITPEDDMIHRAIADVGYTFLKETKTGLFLEAAIVDFNEIEDNTWFLFGLTTNAGWIDRIQAELEFKSDRLMDGSNDADLAWMLLIQKKIAGLTFDLNVGADPKSLGSTTPAEVGGILRVTAKF